MDNVTKQTISNTINSKINSGMNNLPDWVTNYPVGTTQLGTPYFDSVKFLLDNSNETDEYINTVISVTNSANVARSFINGRKGGSIKQMVGEGDWDITFNIKIFSDFLIDSNRQLNDNITIQKVGTGFNSNLSINSTGININDPLSPIFQRVQPHYQGDYYPNDSLSRLISFLTKFYQDQNFINIKVESLYLNDIFNIYNIVPYSINTQQNTEDTNMYNIIIQAYSDFADNTNDYSEEIIPI